jgi:ribokinase
MKALTIGGAMVDTIAIIDSERIERISMRNADTSFLLLEEGSKTEAHEIATHCGGGAVNAAVSMARLGVDVAALVKLGQDARAETVLARLQAEGVSPRFATRDRRAPTGASVLVSSHDRNAAVFTFRGANTLLEVADLKADAFAVDLVYVSSLSNQSADCFPEIVQRAKSAGALLATNPGPRQLAARATAFRDCLPKIDILAINRAEAEVMLPTLIASHGEGGAQLEGADLPRLAARGLAGGGFRMSLKAFLAALLGLGPKTVLLTDGTGGAYAASAGRIVHSTTLQVPVAGTAGAGDAFTSTFATWLALGAPLEDCLVAATTNAASVVGFTDTQSGLLRRADLETRIATNKATLAIRRWALA